jgi:hypothetical protein
VNPRLTVSVLALVGYLLAARGVENFYPLSTFPMYSGEPGSTASRIMALGEGGLVEVTDLVDWRCDKLPHLETATCGDARTVPYLDREREAYIRSHAGAGNQSYLLVRRVFSFDRDAKERADCTLARCRARRR